jgi:hypothetical protein
VFVTDREENATSLRKQYHKEAIDFDISIYSAVLDFPAYKFSPREVKESLIRNVRWFKPLYVDLGSYLGSIRTSLLQSIPVGWRWRSNRCVVQSLSLSADSDVPEPVYL